MPIDLSIGVSRHAQKLQSPLYRRVATMLSGAHTLHVGPSQNELSADLRRLDIKGLAPSVEAPRKVWAGRMTDHPVIELLGLKRRLVETIRHFATDIEKKALLSADVHHFERLVENAAEKREPPLSNEFNGRN